MLAPPRRRERTRAWLEPLLILIVLALLAGWGALDIARRIYQAVTG